MTGWSLHAGMPGGGGVSGGMIHVQRPMGYGQPGEQPDSLILCDAGLLAH